MFKRVLVAALMASAFTLTPAAADDIADYQESLALLQAGEWSAAEEVLTRLIASNPQQGRYWHYRAVARARYGDCAAALPDFETALSLGSTGSVHGMRRAYFDAAACASEVGETDRAIAYLGTAQGRYGLDVAGQTGDDARFDPIRTTPGFAWLAGSDTADLSRDAGWRHDIRWFDDLVRRRHPNPFHSVSEADWAREIEALYASTPRLSDIEMVAGFMRLACLINDGHTAIYPPFDGEMAFSLLPVWPYLLGDRWTILAAAPGYEDLIGAEIDAIEGVPIDAAIDVIDAHMASDHAQTVRWIGAIALQFSDIGAAFFGASQSDHLSLTLSHPGGARFDVSLPGSPIDRNIMSRWAPDGWSSLASATPPLWLQEIDETFRIVPLPQMDALYVQINQIRDGETMDFETFAETVHATLETGGQSHLILDLRHNNGGNGHLNTALVHAIIRSETINRRGGLFVITGRRTFSAAQLLINTLDFETDAIFVGEISSSSPTFYGEDTMMSLPWSGLSGSISSRWFQNYFMDDDERPWIPVDLPAPLTREALMAGEDPALDAIAARIAQED